MLTEYKQVLVPFSALILPPVIRMASESLLRDIEEHGLIEPFLCQATDEGFLIVKGTRRWFAITELFLMGDHRFWLVPVEIIVPQRRTCDD